MMSLIKNEKTTRFEFNTVVIFKQIMEQTRSDDNLATIEQCHVQRRWDFPFSHHVVMEHLKHIVPVLVRTCETAESADLQVGVEVKCICLSERSWMNTRTGFDGRIASTC